MVNIISTLSSWFQYLQSQSKNTFNSLKIHAKTPVTPILQVFQLRQIYTRRFNFYGFGQYV